MHHHDSRPARFVDRLDRTAHPGGGTHAQAPSPADWHHLAEAVTHEWRRLDDRSRGGLPQMRTARKVDRPDELERRHAGIDGKALFTEYVEGPQRVPADRPLGRTE